MMAADRLSQIKIPEKAPAVASGPAKETDKRTDLPDFDSLLSESSRAKNEEIAKEKAAAGGDLQLGESKTDKEFRQMLEKVTGKKQDKLKNKLEKDDYLNLMVTQLKYQDPTKPMENQEMATQLAQFNTVEQLMAANKTLGELKSQSSLGQVDKLTPYLGKFVEVKGDKISVEKGKVTSEASFQMPNAATSSSVQIKDSQGTVVRSLAMGALETGNHKIQFDGKDDKGVVLPSGRYSFQVVASSADGKAIEAIPQIKVRVDGIADISSGGKLDTSGGKFDVADILSIKSSPEDAAVSSAPAPAAAAATAGAAQSSAAATSGSLSATASKTNPAAATPPAPIPAASTPSGAGATSAPATAVGAAAASNSAAGNSALPPELSKQMESIKNTLSSQVNNAPKSSSPVQPQKTQQAKPVGATPA